MKKYFALGGRMTKWKGRVASVAPNLASVSVVALVASGAMATADVVDTASSLQYNMGTTDDLTITDSGAIVLGTGATWAVNLADKYIGTVENSGSIDLSEVDYFNYGGYDDTYATGIWVNGDLGDTLYGGYVDNTDGGSIIVDLTHQPDISGEDPSFMYGFGIFAEGALLGDSQMTNAGTVTVSAAGSEAEKVIAAGMGSYWGSADDAVVSNSGTISVSGTGTAANVYATGIQEGYTSTSSTGVNNDYLYLFGETAGDILNSGDISATATAYGVFEGPDAHAYATGIYATTMSNGSIDNTSTGDLTVRATIHGADGTSGFALAQGIWVEGIVDDTSTISTTGSIDVTAIGSDGGDAVAYGIEIGSSDGIYGGYDNTGIYNDTLVSGNDTITVWYAGSGASLLDGTLTIGGDVTATALVTTPEIYGGTAAADGVYVMYALNGSTIETTDTATLSAIATADGGADAWADGVFLGLSDGTVTLGGDINVSATTSHIDGESGGDALADGVLTFASSSGAVFKATGTITVSADAQDGGVAHADGVLTMFNVNQENPTFRETTLSGTISVDASGAGALAVGSLSYFNFGTLTTNSGTITATAYAWAPETVGPHDGYGSFDTNLIGAIGMGAYVNYLSAIVNTGEINVSANVDTTSDLTGLYGAAGIGVMANVMGLVANTGTINASATNVVAAGIAVAGNSGLVLNSGTIQADAYGDDGQAIGVFVDGSTSYTPGVFINTGKIVATNNSDNEGHPEGIAVYAQTHLDGENDEFSQVVLASGGFIEGEIIVSGEESLDYEGLTHLDVLGTAGSSINWTVYGEDANALETYFDNVDGLYYADNQFGTTVFMGHEAESAIWQFTTIDSSQFAAQRESMLDASDQSSSVQASQTEAALASGKFKAYGIATHSNMTYSGTGASPVTADPVGLYMGLYGDGLTDIGAYSNISGGTLDRDVTTSTLSAGGTMKTDGGLAVGFGIGGQSGEAKMSSAYMTSSDTTYDGAYAGVSFAGQSKSFTFGGGLTAGTMSNSYDRWANNNLVVGGIDQASGDYTSRYITAQAAASGHFKLGFGVTVSPGVTLRYTNGRIDAYSETGDLSAALASVAEQSFGIMESQFDLNVEKSLGLGSLNANLSVTKRALSSSDSVDVTMVGDQENVSGFTADTTTKTLSIGYSASLSTGLSLSIEASRPIGSDDVSGTTVGGGLQLAF